MARSPLTGTPIEDQPKPNANSVDTLVLYVPEVEEIRISPVVARKGFLNVLEHKSNGWKKRWVVCVWKIVLIFVFLMIGFIGGQAPIRVYLQG